MQKYNFLTDIKKYKKWKNQIIDGFFVDNDKDFFFDEYGIVSFNEILKHVKKISKINKEEDFINLLKKGDISLKYKGHIVVGSFFGYTLDNILNIFIGYRENLEVFSIKTNTREISLLPGQKILTNQGYKNIEDIKIENTINYLLGNSYTYKKYRYKNNNKVTIEEILNNLEEILIDNNGVIKNINDYKNEIFYKHIFYLGLKIDKGKITLKNFKKIKEKILKNSKITLEELLETQKDSNFFGNEKIISIEKIRKSGYVSNYITSISENVIVNNFLIKQM